MQAVSVRQTDKEQPNKQWFDIVYNFAVCILHCLWRNHWLCSVKLNLRSHGIFCFTHFAIDVLPFMKLVFSVNIKYFILCWFNWWWKWAENWWNRKLSLILRYRSVSNNKKLIKTMERQPVNDIYGDTAYGHRTVCVQCSLHRFYGQIYRNVSHLNATK